MEFAREVLDIPAPRVFSWSGVRDNPVKAEYILMERVPGIDLATRWPLINRKEHIPPLLSDVLDIEAKFEHPPFSQFGSLYFKEDVSSELQERPLFSPSYNGDLDPKFKAASEKYRIGPIADRPWWSGGRHVLNVDRGPCKLIRNSVCQYLIVSLGRNATSFFLAPARLQLAWMDHPDFAATPQFRAYPLLTADFVKHLIKLWIEIIPLIMPPVEHCSPTMWHPDLNDGNIMVAPEESAHVTGLIDWQHAKVAPYFVQIGIPRDFLYKGTLLPIPSGYKFPTLPSDFDTYSPEEQIIIRRDHKLIVRHKCYEALLVMRKNHRRMSAGMIPHLHQLANLPHDILLSWSQGPHSMYESLKALVPHLDAIVSEPETVKAIRRNIELLQENLGEDIENRLEGLVLQNKHIESVIEVLGCGGDGLVSHDKFQVVQQECEKLRPHWEKSGSPDFPFPFADGRYSYFLS